MDLAAGIRLILAKRSQKAECFQSRRYPFGLGGSACGRIRQPLGGLRQQPVNSLAIRESREPCPEACLYKLGIGGRQRVLAG
jgi:hypothetical protein